MSDAAQHAELRDWVAQTERPHRSLRSRTENRGTERLRQNVVALLRDFDALRPGEPNSAGCSVCDNGEMLDENFTCSVCGRTGTRHAYEDLPHAPSNSALIAHLIDVHREPHTGYADEELFRRHKFLHHAADDVSGDDRTDDRTTFGCPVCGARDNEAHDAKAHGVTPKPTDPPGANHVPLHCGRHEDHGAHEWESGNLNQASFWCVGGPKTYDDEGESIAPTEAAVRTGIGTAPASQPAPPSSMLTQLGTEPPVFTIPCPVCKATVEHVCGAVPTAGYSRALDFLKRELSDERVCCWCGRTLSPAYPESARWCSADCVDEARAYIAAVPSASVDYEIGVDDLCNCGHRRESHIYHEGACRPGYSCKNGCKKFRAAASNVDAQRGES